MLLSARWPWLRARLGAATCRERHRAQHRAGHGHQHKTNEILVQPQVQRVFGQNPTV